MVLPIKKSLLGVKYYFNQLIEAFNSKHDSRLQVSYTIAVIPEKKYI